MHRTHISICLGVILASLVAWKLGGDKGAGTVIGFLFGAFLGLVAAHWQAHVAHTRPAAVMQANLTSFMIILFGVMIGGFAMRYLLPAEGAADWRAFLLSYSAAGVIAITAGAFDTMYVLKEETSQ
ncbi:MAG: putative membrane protein [Planctomycetota bacterium]|jgi:uncharacterized membrane protein